MWLITFCSKLLHSSLIFVCKSCYIGNFRSNTIVIFLFQKWIESGNPKSYWLSGLFFPQGIILIIFLILLECMCVCTYGYVWHMYSMYILYIYEYHILYIYIYIYGIHHCMIFRSSYRKLVRVGFEPTNTEFRSDDQTDWVIRPRVQLALRANFLQPLQFHLFVQCSHFMSVFAFVNCHICPKRSLAQVITPAAELIDTYRINHWRIFRRSYRKLAWVEFESMTTEFRSEALTDWAIRSWIQLAMSSNIYIKVIFETTSQHLSFSSFILTSSNISIQSFWFLSIG